MSTSATVDFRSLPSMRAERDRLARELHRRQAEADAANDGAMTEEQALAFDELQQAFEKLKGAIQRREYLDAQDNRETRGVTLSGGGDRQFQTAARNFNICRAIAGLAGLRVDDGAEREVSNELARRSGRKVEGMLVPFTAFHAPVEHRVMTPGTTGAGLIGTYLDETQFVDVLRPAVVAARMGARWITGLDTQIDLPRLSAAATAQWVSDGSGITTDTTETFDKVSLRPHLLGGICEFTRNMLLTSTPQIQDAARNDLVQVIARGLDLAVIAGSGAPQPTGILNASGLTIVSGGTNGAALSWPNVLSLIEAVQLANAPGQSLGWVGNPRVRAAAMGTLRFSGVAAGTIMEDPDRLAGYAFASTTQCPSNGTKGSGSNLSTLIFGDWSEVLVGIWGEGVEILVNPYGSTQFAAGNVQVRALISADVEFRHIASFAAMTDIIAS